MVNLSFRRKDRPSPCHMTSYIAAAIHSPSGSIPLHTSTYMVPLTKLQFWNWKGTAPHIGEILKYFLRYVKIITGFTNFINNNINNNNNNNSNSNNKLDDKKIIIKFCPSVGLNVLYSQVPTSRKIFYLDLKNVIFGQIHKQDAGKWHMKATIWPYLVIHSPIFCIPPLKSYSLKPLFWAYIYYYRRIKEMNEEKEMKIKKR